MANVSFLNLDEAFEITDDSSTAYDNSGTVVGGGTLYSYFTPGTDDWEIFGANITESAQIPTGGTVDRIAVDFGNENNGVFEIDITNIADVDIVDFSIGVGTAAQQNNAFWHAALQNSDTLDFTLADPSVQLYFAGDGANVDDGDILLGASDSFVLGASVLTGNSRLFGDFYDIIDGTGIGGDDTFTNNAYALAGDFQSILSGATGIGGDDVFLPTVIVDAGAGDGEYFVGDSIFNSGTLAGGDDLIDLRSADISGLTQLLRLYGESLSSNGAIAGGDDTIYGSANGDLIYGESGSISGVEKGGKDLLQGRGGDDTIFGNGGADDIDGGSGNDSLVGGQGRDTIFGNDDDDIIQGDEGNDTLEGGKGLDNIVGGDGNDSIKGNNGGDDIEGNAGNDTLKGDGGEDTITGGGGADEIFGNDLDDRLNGSGGNDTLTGGKGSDRLDGGSDNDRLVGGNGSDTLIGGGGNDTLVGDGGADVFEFGVGKGEDQINDFEFAGGDKIDVSDFGTAFDTFGEVQNEMIQDGNDVVINFGGGDMLRIVDATIGDFSAGDFIFS